MSNTQSYFWAKAHNGAGFFLDENKKETHGSQKKSGISLKLQKVGPWIISLSVFVNCHNLQVTICDCDHVRTWQVIHT